jgi:type VI secretion system protein VasI
MSDRAGGGTVTYRVDRLPPRTQPFSVSNDNKSLGLWGATSAIPFIKSLFGAERLLLRATPFRESDLNLEFNVSGLEEAIKPLRTACKW